MKHVPLSKLEDKIIRPGFEARLEPLLRFKGSVTLGRAHRMWNLLVASMEHEATYKELLRDIQLNKAHSQLCGPETAITLMQLRSFTGRVMQSPTVLAEAPHLSQYIRDLLLPRLKGPFSLEPWKAPPETFAERAEGRSIKWALAEFGVDYRVIRRWFEEAGVAPEREPSSLIIPVPKQWQSFAERENNIELSRRFGVSTHTVARWRAETGAVCLATRNSRGAEGGSIVYPFVIHDGGKPEHALLRKVSAAVPKHFDAETRADICQDLVVGILCGDFSEDDLQLPSKEMTKRVFRMFPTKYGPLSLDAIMPGTDDFRLMDTISEEDGLWANL